MLLHAIESPRSVAKNRFDLIDSAELGDFPKIRIFLSQMVLNHESDAKQIEQYSM